jgi:prepilin-type N-terminal cleavage/methylation domain-containing protein
VAKGNLKQGFTLIELLVVISIIGLLASVVLVSLNSARSKARDTKRKADLAQIAKALEFYYDQNNTYQVTAGGYRSVPANPATACGCGWLGYKDGGAYPLAVTEVLKNSGFLSQTLIDDPKGPNPSYMIYLANNGGNPQFCLYATLENPTAAETALIDSSCAPNVDTDYGKNYVYMN